MSLVLEERGGAFWIGLARPPVNVLDVPTIEAISAALASLPERRDLKAVVFHSSLPGVFSAGVEVRDHARDRVATMLSTFHALLLLLDRLPQATIAAVDGPCLGGGCELAAFCDILLASPRAEFGQPEIDLGCFPPVASVLLPRLVGRVSAALILGGERIGAAEALRIGLVTAVVEDLEAATAAWAARLAAKSGAALALARRSLREGAQGSFADALARAERRYREEMAVTEDAEEGVRAFLEKRPPRWRDR